MRVGVRGLGLVLMVTALSGCGVGNFGGSVGGGGGTARLQGNVHGGQQPVALAKVYLYAVSTTSVGGASSSLLNAPGYVLTDLNGNFSITGDYTCPMGAYVYALALGGNPGLTGVVSNPELALAAGLGACNALTPSTFFTVNEVTTVALAYSLASYTSSETQIGGVGSTSTVPGFMNIRNLIDPTRGTVLPKDALGSAVPQAEINALGNSLAACVNSSGVGGTCAQLMSATGTAGAGGTPVDTFQAVLNVANNPNANVTAIYNIGAANGPFQPSLTAAPANWTVTLGPTTAPPAPPGGPGGPAGNLPFFAGQTIVQPAQGSSPAIESLPFFGTYSYLSDASYINHNGLGFEYTVDAGDGQSGIYFYDFMSQHYWYTSPSLFPYVYDFTLNSYLYYFAGSNPREFYDFATSTYINI